MKLTIIDAFDIGDAWYKCVSAVLQEGYEWEIKRGSFVGHKRKEFDNVIITIRNPSNRPLAPDMPQDKTIPPPTSMRAIQEYLALLITPENKGYDYTYGERIAKQLDKALKMLKETPDTNQCTIEIGRPEDIDLKDPPCLRLIDIRVRYGKLHFFVYFRSWDLWSGFPVNLGGLQLLKEWMARELGLEDGTLNAWSKGLHLYDFSMELAKELVKPTSRRAT